MPHVRLHSARFELEPITLPMIEAIFFEREREFARLLDADLPTPWPGRALIERAFSADLEAIRREPDWRLWGDRIIIDAKGAAGNGERRRILGSVVFHGHPDEHGQLEIAYGVEQRAQGQGVATEAVSAQVEWALSQPGVHTIRATTPPWHLASRRVLEKCGFSYQGEEEHDTLGEVVAYACRR